MDQQSRKSQHSGGSIRVSDFLRDAQARQPEIGKRTVAKPRPARIERSLSQSLDLLRVLLRTVSYGPLGKIVQFGLAIVLYIALMHLDLGTGLSSRLFGTEQSGGVMTLSAPKGETLAIPD